MSGIPTHGVILHRDIGVLSCQILWTSFTHLLDAAVYDFVLWPGRIFPVAEGTPTLLLMHAHMSCLHNIWGCAAARYSRCNGQQLCEDDGGRMRWCM